ncbi:hypothetical protein C8R46DRAFT_1188109 [Mycena filopes]|nr:hypothetical protein C8R46DRAFT_1188109 [Mycena filopes]
MVNIQDMFGPQPAKMIPADAQTLPPPSKLPQPPYRMLYGWVMESSLFEPKAIVQVYEDGSRLEFPPPTTVGQAAVIFNSVSFGLQIHDALLTGRPSLEGPCIAHFAEARMDKDSGAVRSHLGSDKIPSKAKISKLMDIMHLRKEPEWIDTSLWLIPARKDPLDARNAPLAWRNPA